MSRLGSTDAIVSMAKRAQNPRTIGRDHDTRPKLMKFRSLLIQRNVEPALVQSKRGDESADAAASNKHVRLFHGLQPSVRSYSGTVSLLLERRFSVSAYMITLRCAQRRSRMALRPQRLRGASLMATSTA
jgi:hypothetical protein